MLRLRQINPPDGLSSTTRVALLIGLVLAVVVFVIPATGLFETPDVRNDLGEATKGRVVRVIESRVQDGPRGEELYQRLEVEVDRQIVTIERTQVEGDSLQLDLRAGTKVLVSRPSEDASYDVVDYARDGSLWLMGGAFAVLVAVVGRWRGVMSLVGMVASLLVILRFIIPGIVAGYDPVVISVIGSAVIMATSLYLAHGINSKTTTALIGTTVSLAITAALATFGVDLARLTGLADEQAATLNILTDGGINPQGLLLAGMIIGALGVLDDVTVAQASAVFEIRGANPFLSARDVFGRAMNVGRDHIASTVNTLFLAYAGASLPLLIILSLQTESMGILANREFLATEIVRTLVGSIGIVASVPLTTALATYTASRLAPDADLPSVGHSQFSSMPPEESPSSPFRTS